MGSVEGGGNAAKLVYDSSFISSHGVTPTGRRVCFLSWYSFVVASQGSFQETRRNGTDGQTPAPIGVVLSQ